MTHDEEIIKEATEIYEKNENGGALVGDLLRIIKSQKAEVERFEKEQKALLLTIERARKERVRIQTILVNFMDEIYVFGNKNNVDTNSFAQIAILGSERDSAVKQIKSEAYREFAEKLKKEVAHIPAWGRVAEKKIDNTLKELTESKNDLEG